jgi:hypothetical protein
MAILQLTSAAPPFDRPALGMRAVRVMSLAEAMGLLSGSAPIERLDRDAIERPIDALVQSGIGRDFTLEFQATRDPVRLAALIDRLYAELEASPAPISETRFLADLLGHELLGRLVQASPSSLRRYAAGERLTPQEVAARLHHLALVVAALAGGYNDFGIRRWFMRPRPQLYGQSPAQVLQGQWDPDDGGPHRVRELAEALNSSPAT